MSELLDYELPERLIAQEPTQRLADALCLLVVRRSTATLEHHHFADLPQLLAPADLLVLNDTRVVPARLLGRRERTSGKWEGLYLRTLPDGLWELLCQTRGKLAPGEVIRVDPDGLLLTLVEQREGRWLAARPDQPGSASALLRHGRIPLPPYIRKGRANPEDRDRYQTVYAAQEGAVAAPTAGLHFTPELFEELDRRGVSRAFLTLHVGIGTFQPIKTEDVRAHVMHREEGELSAATVASIDECKQRGGRVIAVGTTSVRVLETVAATGALRAWSGATELFIYPPFDFHAVEGLVTNFHLPRSTLLLLVAAFAGEELIREAYRTAVAHDYRFFSYGDAMLIL